MKALILKALTVISCILQISCEKDNDTPPSNTVTDIDGNIYHSVTIGTQIWMVENLKTTKYRNGDLIGTTAPASLDISGESTPKYQWANDSKESNVADYGRLYTWYVVNDNRNICPVGWHIPRDAEWTELIDYLGGEAVAGGKLKESGTSHWSYPNEGTTNKSGFTALPGGYHEIYGTFLSVGGYGIWWSATEFDETAAWSRSIFNEYTSVVRLPSNKQGGYSVRCIRD